MGNSWYDRMVVAGRKPSPVDREAEFVKIETDLNEELKRHRDWRAMAATILFDKRSEQIGYIFISLMLPATRAAVNAQNRGEMQADLIRLGFAFAADCADHGGYPQKLGELTPQYIAKVPVDVSPTTAPCITHAKERGICFTASVPTAWTTAAATAKKAGRPVKAGTTCRSA